MKRKAKWRLDKIERSLEGMKRKLSTVRFDGLEKVIAASMSKKKKKGDSE